MICVPSRGNNDPSYHVYVNVGPTYLTPHLCSFSSPATETAGFARYLHKCIFLRAHTCHLTVNIFQQIGDDSRGRTGEEDRRLINNRSVTMATRSTIARSSATTAMREEGEPKTFDDLETSISMEDR
ncbi:hypothetical protein L484_019840 [Morus notabilis]|uniref:Uncharacterized protein n=1 Tax=Morus notabilis TaxID=981085 RepID=W9SHR9_9ROSA|nr:hypothetical protein L484_019840 [Morus notabilis]